MGFSEKMRESLGAGGATVDVAPPDRPVAAGTTAAATVTIRGGNRPAHVDALIVRVVQAHRHWVQPDGGTITELDAMALPDRSELTAGWTRRPISEERTGVHQDVDVGSETTIEVQLVVPGDSEPTCASIKHTLNVQADIKGQIDPTGNVNMTVA